MLAFLQAAYDPETAGFGICEFVDMTANGFNVVVAEDDFDAGVGAAATTVHDGSAQPAVEEKVHIIKWCITLVFYPVMMAVIALIMSKIL